MDFKLDLLTQNWIDHDINNNNDYCSHGKVLLIIHDIILSDENSDEWTVASSALRLMKSAIINYDSEKELEIIPCCGYLSFPSCPTYITWDTKIEDDLIIISNIQQSKNETNGLKVIKDHFEIKYLDYINKILKFAEKIIEFYNLSSPREIFEDYEKEFYRLFWEQFNEYYEVLKTKTST